MQKNDPIVAIATPPGRGGIGVVRLSGPNLSGFIFSLTGKVLTPRYATYTDFRAADQSPLDSGLALYFPAPHSFTGEDVLELQAHGGPVVLKMLQSRCMELGARLAEPGEFTKRAFLNDKLDLAQAESVADLINATSDAAVRSAVKSLQGVFSAEIHRLVDQLVHLRMLVEATLDFPEEEIDFLKAADATGQLQAIQAQLRRVLEAAQQGRLLQEGMHIVLIGQPNVGKSSLLNALAGFDAAIVTEIAGTTRDTVREKIHLDGIPLHVIDTAGLRETVDKVEQIGISRTWEAIAQADLILLVMDSTQGISPEDRSILSQLPSTLPCVHVYNKIDLSGQAVTRQDTDEGIIVQLSAKTGQGLNVLRQTLLEIVGWHQTEEGVFMARERHLKAIGQAASLLDEAAESEARIEIFAENLRLAQLALCEITGEFTADDLLGEIFSRFCIGK
jgi:tRNA modification GTPase